MKAFFRASLLGLLFLARPVLQAADSDTNSAWLAEHYTKYEHRIPMRDGVRLFTRVYVPKDESHRWPIILTRTPYALKPYGSDNYTDPSGSFLTLARDRFILVTQDVRGRYGSEGTYVHVRPFNPNKGPKDIDENSDTWDTIEWLVKHVPNNSGLVGMFGISYPGFYTSMGMIDSHPALKAASPQAPISDWFMGDDLNHNGAFFLAQNFDFFFRFAQKVEDPLHDEFRSFNFKTPDGYDFFLRMGPLANSDKVLLKGRALEWTEFLTHPTYDDYWKARNIRPHLKNIRCAVMTVGGWFDAEDLFGPLETYRATERQNPGITNMLVMGPWAHGGWGRGPGDTLGHFSFRAKTSEYYREKIELPFFRHFLKGDTNYTPTEAHIFETGTHVWRKFDAWPPKQVVPRTLYLRAGGALAFSPPTEGAAFDEYVSDPAKPVPFTADQSTTYPRAYPIEDQRFVASRPDVLVYETEPLEEDLTFAGPLHATFHVSTTGTDSDWVIKLVDVYPGDYPNPVPNPANVKLGGAQQLVRGDVFRGKFRNSFEKPEPFVPGQPAKIAFAIPDVCHTFRRGHRVMIQVQSSWFPLVDRNPQTFVNIPTAKPEDFRKATQRVYRSAGAATSLTVQVLPAAK
ncbi:MAG: CocE/NonD family hydrolase [Verrucomicrobia bacterium]|nr:CocE/NonD family hydrolase [Verrucomicrobiota bacterium]NBU10054.1 CocE/NonD family hydrolase [Pseudomonadota bacterium]NDD38062.1 CocE/NonD family hydrolase [Verrucomicrobiota bacterium]NDE97450.1 CocE/NonD family hydrolase [Verrucomicrobiota bacterium]